MKKIIKKYGNSLVIHLNPEEIKIYNLEEGDLVDVELVKLKEDKSEIRWLI